MQARLKKVPAIFYRTESGNEPVRAFLAEQDKEDRRLIGQDIAKVEYGWPIGMPTAKALGEGLHEVRTDLRSHRISRVFFLYQQARRDGPPPRDHQEDSEDAAGGSRPRP